MSSRNCVLPGCLNRVDRGSAYCGKSCYEDDEEAGFKYSLHEGLYLSNGSTGPPFAPGIFCVDDSPSCPSSPVIGTMYEAAAPAQEENASSKTTQHQNPTDAPERNDEDEWVVKGERPAASSGLKRKSRGGNQDKYKTTQSTPRGGGKQTSVTSFFSREN